MDYNNNIIHNDSFHINKVDRKLWKNICRTSIYIYYGYGNNTSLILTRRIIDKNPSLTEKLHLLRWATQQEISYLFMILSPKNTNLLYSRFYFCFILYISDMMKKQKILLVHIIVLTNCCSLKNMKIKIVYIFYIRKESIISCG